MARNLLLANLIEDYSFDKTKKFMSSEISVIIPSSVDEVIFLTNAYDGNDETIYQNNVSELFGDVNVTFINANVSDIPTINTAKVIAVGGGNMLQLELNTDELVREAIRRRINDGIPYIGWNAGSIFACPTKIESLSTLSNDLLGLVPFQFVSHFNDNDQNRVSIQDFLKRHEAIKYVVCFSDHPVSAATQDDAEDENHVYGTAPTSPSGEEEKGSGVRVEDENAGLSGFESSATLVLFSLENGALVQEPITNIGNIM